MNTMENRKLSFYMGAVLVLLMFVSCRDKQLDNALSLSGDNRHELEKVLDHYRPDQLKYKAACFLISNMLGHSRHDSLSVDRMQPYYDKLHEISLKYDGKKSPEWRNETNAYWEKVKLKARSSLYGMKADIHELKADWLIREIDLAFRAWQENEYSRSESFDTFCKYILPYCIHNGICADESRSVFYKRHAGWFSDGKLDFQTKVDSLLYLYKYLVHNDFAAASLPILSLGSFEYIGKGLCDDRCKFNFSLLSSLGMPVVQDFVPAWGNRHGGHSWNAIVLDEETYPFEPFWDEDRWKYKRIYNNECFDLLWGKFRLPKVYRYTYESYLEGPLAERNISSSDIPPFFRNPFIKDVSSQYFKTSDVRITLTEPVPDGAEYCYLCVFDPGEWQPVQWGKIEKNKEVNFKGMGRDIVYLPMYYKGGILTPAASAFLLKADGTCEEMRCSGEKRQVAVRACTSYLFENIADVKKNLVGACILGCNSLDAVSADTLYCMTDTIDAWYNEILLENPKEYRYIRLVAPGDSIALCEISFYEQGKEDMPVTGVQASTNITPFTSSEKVEMMVDNLSATACSGSADKKGCGGGFVCFDLKKPRVIHKISYIPYTQSRLSKDKEMKLCYWDNRWVEAGALKGDYEYLVFDEVPEGTIYRVKLERLKDRIFTYNNGILRWY